MNEWKYRFFLLVIFLIGYWLGSIRSKNKLWIYIGPNEQKYKSAMFGILTKPNP